MAAICLEEVVRMTGAIMGKRGMGKVGRLVGA